jgi:hypothetical protein
MKDEVLDTAVQLAQKTQSVRTMGDSLAVIIGQSSIAQMVMNVRKKSAQLVFSLQNDAPRDVQLEQLKTLQGDLLGLQAYGIITDVELEKYMDMADAIYNGISKR